ncbi:MAG TPA: PD-(D/E)XK nuclease family protein [Acidimicrobiales bacterium]|nr:PD-(D/E)XK nuclease family protein [Acidimicrobiales bacterium]
MSLQLPGSLTPSKVATFKECALAFRLSAIDKLPEPPNVQAFRGTVVHRALELLMWEEDQGHRTVGSAMAKLGRAFEELLVSEEGQALGLAGTDLEELIEDARLLVANYFVLEDPNEVRVIGTELRLQVERVARLRGIIDRLELDRDGELVVTDYKTGRAPGISHEQARLGGVHFYAFLCEQVLGKRPVRVQLFHLREPIAISTTPDDQSISGLERQASAIWAAITRACVAEDFRPKPGPLCEWCGYHAYCPAMGGDLSLLKADGSGPDGGPLGGGAGPVRADLPTPLHAPLDGAAPWAPAGAEGASEGLRLFRLPVATGG